MYVRRRMIKDAVPGMVLGICSIAGSMFYLIPVFGIINCIGTLIMGIMAINLGAKAKRIYFTGPHYYSRQSLGMARTAFTCGIVGTSLSAIMFIAAIQITADAL